MNLKICPLLGKECQYTDCMLYEKATAQCSISIIAVELRSVAGSADYLAETVNGIEKIANAAKGLV